MADKKQLLSDIIDETCRANESIVAEALDLAYDGPEEKCFERSREKDLCLCAVREAEGPKQ